MKKLAAVLLASVLAVSFAFAGQTNPADQKWLEAVEKMVVKGDKKISTPNEQRISMLKEWAGKKGYSVQVTKTETGYSIELSKSLARK